jgi:hypothetical protein
VSGIENKTMPKKKPRNQKPMSLEKRILFLFLGIAGLIILLGLGRLGYIKYLDYQDTQNKNTIERTIQSLYTPIKEVNPKLSWQEVKKCYYPNRSEFAKGRPACAIEFTSASPVEAAETMRNEAKAYLDVLAASNSIGNLDKTKFDVDRITNGALTQQPREYSKLLFGISAPFTVPGARLGEFNECRFEQYFNKDSATLITAHRKLACFFDARLEHYPYIEN